MQYLMVLLVIIGVLMLGVAALLAISYGLGALMYSRDGIRADPSDADPCAQCHADRDWFEGLPIWKQNVVTAWWWANRYTCAAKGCR